MLCCESWFNFKICIISQILSHFFFFHFLFSSFHFTTLLFSSLPLFSFFRFCSLSAPLPFSFFLSSLLFLYISHSLFLAPPRLPPFPSLPPSSLPFSSLFFSPFQSVVICTPLSILMTAIPSLNCLLTTSRTGSPNQPYLRETWNSHFLPHLISLSSIFIWFTIY